MVESLSAAKAYRHPVADVERRETHISWLFLTGELAYKVKKPVRLEFLDFSTLEKRRHFCEEEVRLNRRFAPQIYLDVVPVTGPPEAAQIEGDGPVIDYAVRMRQFDDRQLFSRLIERQALTADHIDDLATTVADFHAGAERAAAGTPHGDPDAIWQQAEDNFTALRQRASADAAPVDALESWTKQEFARCREHFVARRRDGFVRECHGDLHLGNLVLIDGRPVLFDGIEFSDEFRWIDVMSDVAFVVMDLEDHGRDDLAHRFVNAYMEATRDDAGLHVLRWYAVYRALVRAKVAAIRADQSGSDSGEAHAEMQTYLALGQRLMRPPRPMVIITTGVSGSGKTTQTQPLIEQIGAVRVRSDIERKRLFGLAATDETRSAQDAGIYTQEATERTYDRLAHSARAIAAAGCPAIADATFMKREQRERFRQLAADLNVPFVILPFEADEATLKERLRARAAAGGDASEANVEILERQLATREPIGADERAHCRSPGEVAHL